MQRYASLTRSTLLVVSVLAASLLFSGKTHAQLNGDFSGADAVLNGASAVGLIPPGQTSSTVLPGWTADRSSLNGTIIGDSNVYLFTTNANPFFLPDLPAGSNFGVQLDSTTGFGQSKFDTGASITSDTFSLAPGTYKLSLDATTEVASFNGVPKAGPGGVLISLLTGSTNVLNGTTSPTQFLFDTTGHNATHTDALWTTFSQTFTLAAPATLSLKIADDPALNLVGNLASSNSAVTAISLSPVPEPAPLTLIGVGVVSLVGFQNLLKRRRA